ncbi:NAD-dependent epimerase/dehydratase family protein [Bdellovibrionota bacterium FG-1]
MTSKRILITGASGYLGTSAIRALGSTPDKIIRLSRNNPQADVCLDLTKANIEEIQTLLRDVDAVLHLGSQTSVYQANETPLEDFEANVLPLHKMLEAARKNSIKKEGSPFFILAGSATQYGIPTRNPVDETHADAPVSVYCLHKLMAEQYLELYCRQGWARGCAFRLANVYGPGPKSSSADRGVLNQMIQKALRQEPLTLYGTGEQLRDYIYVDDVVRAFWMAAAQPDAVNGRHFILASGVGTSLADAFQMVSHEVSQFLGRPVEVLRVPPPSHSSTVDLRHFIGNIEALKKALPWKPEVSLTQGIQQTLRFFATGSGEKP